MILDSIRRIGGIDGAEIMHVADETNHVQFIHIRDIKDEEPFELCCEECFKMHYWRPVWVKV